MWGDCRDLWGDEDPGLPPEKWIRRLLAVVLLLIFILLQLGCVSAPVAPNLKLPEASCPKLDLPPVPQKATLQIEGDKLFADEGGELLLRGYVRSRYLLR